MSGPFLSARTTNIYTPLLPRQSPDPGLSEDFTPYTPEPPCSPVVKTSHVMIVLTQEYITFLRGLAQSH